MWFLFRGPNASREVLAPASVSPGPALGVALSFCVPHWGSLFAKKGRGKAATETSVTRLFVPFQCGSEDGAALCFRAPLY